MIHRNQRGGILALTTLLTILRRVPISFPPMKKLLTLLPAFLLLTSCSLTGGSASVGTRVTIDTTKGKIVLELADADAPKTVANFKKLVGQKFYDGLKWHRVVKAPQPFVIQTGDPTGTGSGGSTETIQLEIKCADGKTIEGEVAPATCDPVLKHKKYAVGMARTQEPNTATSQFYITLSETPTLDGKYAVFGYVVEGMDVVDQVALNDTITSITLQ